MVLIGGKEYSQEFLDMMWEAETQKLHDEKKRQLEVIMGLLKELIKWVKCR